MIVTEEEAKTKWCRHARTVERGPDGSTGVRNRVVVDGEDVIVAQLVGCNCIGAACMAWRWVGGWSRDDRSGANGPVVPSKGYCGDAGAP